MTLMIVLFLALALVAGVPAIALAQTLDQQKVDAQKEVEQLQAKLEDAMERYKGACDALAQTRGLISDNTEQITEAEQELTARQANLNKRVRAMYVSRTTGFVDVVVTSGNFDEFLVGMDLLKRVGHKDATLVTGVKEAKAKLVARREQLAEQKSAQQAATKDMADAKASVDSALQQSKGKLTNVEEQIRQAMARRAAEAAAASASGSRVASRVYAPVVRNAIPPGTPHPGVINVAYDQLGKPYVWGATGPNSFDCSGLTSYCYMVGAGIIIPRVSYGQRDFGAQIGVSQLAPGDIIGFRGWGHVGLYAGNGQFIHAPSSGDVVKVSVLSSRRDFAGAVRP